MDHNSSTSWLQKALEYFGIVVGVVDLMSYPQLQRIKSTTKNQTPDSTGEYSRHCQDCDHRDSKRTSMAQALRDLEGGDTSA